MHSIPSCPALIRRFRADERAVSAVEFALILPILILLLLASFDVTRAVDAKKKATQLATVVGDFVSQYQTEVTPTQLASVVNASKFILYPYPATADELTINIEGIKRVSEDPLKFEIQWSYLAGEKTTADKTKRPTTATRDDDFWIQTEVKYTYKLKFASYLTKSLGFSELTMTSVIGVTPRSGTPIAAKW